MDAETLRKAQANPREYASLIVRVGGYSDYFVYIPKRLQDEVIARSHHALQLFADYLQNLSRLF